MTVQGKLHQRVSSSFDPTDVNKAMDLGMLAVTLFKQSCRLLWLHRQGTEIGTNATGLRRCIIKAAKELSLLGENSTKEQADTLIAEAWKELGLKV